MVIFKERFESELKEIFDFISKDSRAGAIKFKEELFDKIYSLSDFLYRCRKSAKFNDEKIRELIHKGYVVVYLIDGELILILGIYKENIWEIL